MSNKVIVEKNLLDGVAPDAAADGVSQNLYLGKRLSVQLIATVGNDGPETFAREDVDVALSRITIAAHGFVTGQELALTTDDALPAPLEETDYYVIVVDEDTFQLAETAENALAGIPIVLEDDGAPGSTNTLTGTALSGASCAIQRSNDGENWDTMSTENISAATNTYMTVNDSLNYKFIRAVKAISAGAAEVKPLLTVIGDAI